MALEKIIVGDDQIEYARKVFPYIPGAEVEFVSSPEEIVSKAMAGGYTMIVTDLQYTRSGEEGFSVLEQLKDVPARKILWTGMAYDASVRERGKSLGAEVLDKDEISSLVGQVVSKAPLKEEGSVLIYAPAGTLKRNIAHVVDTIGLPVTVSSELRKELETGEYGLVIDASTLLSPAGERRRGTVAHDMKYIRMKEVPRVVELQGIGTVIADIVRLAGEYLKR